MLIRAGHGFEVCNLRYPTKIELISCMYTRNGAEKNAFRLLEPESKRAGRSLWS